MPTDAQTRPATPEEDIRELYQRVARLNDVVSALLNPAWGSEHGYLPQGHPLRVDLRAASSDGKQGAPTDSQAVELQPYSGDKPTCPKCSNKGAFTEYRAHGKCLHDRAGGVLGFSPNERLHRQCTRCDYAWDEAIVISRPAGCGPECSEMHTETGRCEIAMARRVSRAAGPSDDASAECRSCEHPRHAPGECTEQLDGDDCTCQEEN